MEILHELGPQAQYAGQLVYDALTNNGVVGLDSKDKDVVQFGFKDLFTLGNAIESSDVELDTKDLMTSTDLTRMIGTQITKIVEEAIEPDLLVIPNLFQEVNYSGPGRSIEIGGMGAFHAGEVGEGTEYPEQDFNYAEGDMVAVGISKHGLKVTVTEEVLEDNLFDVFGLWMRMAGRALARHKEISALKLINEFGYTVFDNAAPTDSEKGVVTGRGIDGAQNGTMSVDDIFDMYTWMYMRGFVPDTIIINPLAWRVFMSDPEIREIILKGATLASKRLPNGSGANRGTSHGGLGYRQGNTGVGLNDPKLLTGANPFTTNLNPMGASWNIQPEYLPSPLKVIVSPYVSYRMLDSGDTPASKPVTNIIMADSTRSGLLLTKDGVSIDKWDDPERDILAMKMKEKWGMALMEQGKGVAVARNIVVDKNYVFDNVNSKALAVLNNTAKVVEV
jgi:hypothetical protein